MLLTNLSYFGIKGVSFIHADLESVFEIQPDSLLAEKIKEIKGDRKLLKVLVTSQENEGYNNIQDMYYDKPLNLNEIIESHFGLKSHFTIEHETILFMENEYEESLEALAEYKAGKIDYDELEQYEAEIHEVSSILITNNKLHPIFVIGDTYNLCSIFVLIFEGDQFEIQSIEDDYFYNE